MKRAVLYGRNSQQASNIKNILHLATTQNTDLKLFIKLKEHT